MEAGQSLAGVGVGAGSLTVSFLQATNAKVKTANKIFFSLWVFLN